MRWTPRKEVIFIALICVIGLAGIASLHFKSDCEQITRLPFNITRSGAYCLGKDLSYSVESGRAIHLKVNNVTLDGAGFCIDGSRDNDTNSYAVYGNNRRSISVKNLCITGFRFGITLEENPRKYIGKSFYDSADLRLSENISIEGNSVRFSTHRGIWVEGERVSIKHNLVERIGGTTHQPHSFAQAIYVIANSCSIEGNKVVGLKPVGNGEGVGIALYDGVGCTVEDNLVDGVSKPEWGRIFGMWIGAKGGESPLIQQNKIVNVDYALGPYGIYKDNWIVDVACSVYSNLDYEKKSSDLKLVLSRHQGTSELFQDKGVDIRDTSGGWSCEDSYEHQLKKFNETGHANYAFGAHLALAMWRDKRDPKVRHQLDVWMAVASLSGHPRARFYTDKNGFGSQKVTEEAKRMVDRAKGSQQKGI